jgi:hypothetical protein
VRPLGGEDGPTSWQEVSWQLNSTFAYSS